VLRLSKVKVDKKEYEKFQKWKGSKEGVSGEKKGHKFRNYILLIIVILVVWFVFGRGSFEDFWGWVFNLF
jgi:uncharacterized ion transporter superfamily protein YfcC